MIAQGIGGAERSIGTRVRCAVRTIRCLLFERKELAAPVLWFGRCPRWDLRGRIDRGQMQVVNGKVSLGRNTRLGGRRPPYPRCTTGMPAPKGRPMGEIMAGCARRSI